MKGVMILKSFCQWLTILIFCLILLLGSVLFFALPDKAFSSEENRTLAQMPDFNSKALFSGSFASDINTYYADQFPFRNQLVRLKSGTELLLLKGENNGVLYSRDQLAVRNFHAYRSRIQIAENTDRFYSDSIEAQLTAVSRFAQNRDIPVFTILPPRTVDIADSAFSYDRPQGDALFTQAKEILGANNGYLDLLPLLREKYESGEYVYYKTDHHWTTLGAYYAYCEFMKALGQGENILPRSAFSIEEIPHFSGTTAAKGNFPLYEKDTLQLWHYPGESDFEVIADGVPLSGLYERKHLEANGDTYSVFLDGTHNITTIIKPGKERQTLLIPKDSFANSLIPFLAESYNIVAVNLRTNTDLTSLIELYDPTAVLLVYNIENLITSGDLGNLR